MDRRGFLRTTAAAAVAAAMGTDMAEAGKKPFPKRELGRTGEKLSIIGFGGVVVMREKQDDANRMVREAIDAGINYFDVAPGYGDAEERLGPALRGHRDKVFLACKTGKRDKAGAVEELERSLKRLETDHLDLYQFHGLSKMEELDKVTGPSGALEAFVEARDKGLVRFLGFSAHSVEVALAAMDRFKFDTILFPINWVCWFKSDFGPQVVKAAKSKGMGILALKALAYTPWPDGVKHEYPKCWYQPISHTDTKLADLALRFALSQPVTATVPPGDIRLFNLAVSLAQRFKPLSDDERKDLEKRAIGVKAIFPQ
jgi:aryl-alcohol dehydrogenase-like predicted oxidoreductase